jgi:fucose permease
VIGGLLVAVALVIVARATALSDLLTAVVLLGVGGGALNGGTNTLVADLHEDPQHKNAALNLLGVFFGFGALLLPFAIGALLARFSLAALILAAAVPCGLVGIYAATLRFPPPKQGHRLPLADMPRFLRDPLVVVLACLLFFQSGVEFTLGGFIATYLTREMSASVSQASWVLTAFWAAIMGTRIVLSRVTARSSPHRVLFSCGCGALAGALLAAAATGPAMAFAGIIVMGISLAGVFPAALGIAGARFESHSGTVFGILFTVALAGGMTLPWTAGQIGESAGLRSVFLLVAFSYAAILGLSRAAARFDRRRGEPIPTLAAG